MLSINFCIQDETTSKEVNSIDRSMDIQYTLILISMLGNEIFYKNSAFSFDKIVADKEKKNFCKKYVAVNVSLNP